MKAVAHKGAGIGNGYPSSSTGVSVFSTGDNGNAVIFADTISDRSGENGWNGIVFLDKDGKIYGNPIVSESFTIESGYTFTIEEGRTLTVEERTVITVHGEMVNNGTIENRGEIEGQVTGKELPMFSYPVVGWKVGDPYVLRPTAENVSYFSISKGNLPEGLSLDMTTGAISGTPSKTGTYQVTVTAVGTYGNNSETIVLTVWGYDPLQRL